MAECENKVPNAAFSSAILFGCEVGSECLLNLLRLSKALLRVRTAAVHPLAEAENRWWRAEHWHKQRRYSQPWVALFHHFSRASTLNIEYKFPPSICRFFISRLTWCVRPTYNYALTSYSGSTLRCVTTKRCQISDSDQMLSKCLLKSKSQSFTQGKSIPPTEETRFNHSPNILTR